MPKLVFDKCTTEENCRKCDVGYILKNYVKPLMQTLTNDVKEYYMRLLTSKCLNTAVMLSIFMLGKNRGIEIANYCDTVATRKRHLDKDDNNNNIISYFKKDILDIKTKHRYLYYILLTDGKFPNKDPTKEPLFFPGHVLILEKIPNDSGKPYYYFYQSYINHYDLKEHIKKNNSSLKLTYEKTEKLLSSLEIVLESPTWNNECVDAWKSFTFADTTHLLDSYSKNNFFLCIRKAKVVDCLKHIEKYTKEKIHDLKGVPLDNKIYGDNSLYDENQKPLTVKQMSKQLNKLYEDVNKYKNNFVTRKN
jgi:hypothetical protein